MPPKLLDHGVVSFKSEGRLLQELGLRLVASPEVALVELVKNAYDADSADCEVRLENDDSQLVVEDHGNGMTIDDFLKKWMQIATSSKSSQSSSPKYNRPLTGAKGIGRFAVRYLGDALTLTSVAQDKKYGLTQLKAEFDWNAIDKKLDLSTTKVPYDLYTAPSGTPTGTTLTIRKLRGEVDFAQSRDMRANVLRLTSPLSGLYRGRFAAIDESSSNVDPGFKVILPGSDDSEDSNLAEEVLSRFWGRLTISLKNGRLTYEVEFPNIKTPKLLSIRVKSAITNGLQADIRFFPRRPGIFRGTDVNGKVAWGWVRDNSGVAVVDHGFRIKPYGFPDDDWLWLDRDGARNRRNWRSTIANEHFAISNVVAARPGENPALNLPSNLQLVGAVFIRSNRAPTADGNEDLIPSMDREGLIENDGLDQLKEFIRGGIEFLTLCDKEEKTRQELLEEKRAAKSAREDIQKAIQSIQENESLTPRDRAAIVKQYKGLAERLSDHEEYSARLRRSLSTMGLLGVVAGFLTHESDAIRHELQEACRELTALAKKNPSLCAAAESMAQRLETLKDYLSYSKLFIGKVGAEEIVPFSASGQANYVRKHFAQFAIERGIKVVSEIGKGVDEPAVPITAYTGILLNLYTNALKALIAVQESVRSPQIVFRAWNEKRMHILEVLDNGVGIPPELRNRIWDPLYSTTTNPNSPLGPGMGLGLSLVKQVVSDLGGSINLVSDPPAGFTTCFRVTLPTKR